MIRDIGGVETPPIHVGVSTPPIYKGSFGETVGSDFPPKLPLRRVGGGSQGTVGARLRRG